MNDLEMYIELEMYSALELRCVMIELAVHNVSIRNV